MTFGIISLIINYDFYQENLQNQIKFPIKCFYFLEKANLLFIGTGNEQLESNEKSGKLGFWFNELKNAFKAPNPKDLIKGELYIFNIIKSHSDELMIVELFTREFKSEITFIKLFKERNYLVVGTYSGEVELFKLYVNEKSCETRDLIEFLGKISYNKKPILNALINFDLGFIYTFSSEISIKVTEINYFGIKI